MAGARHRTAHDTKTNTIPSSCYYISMVLQIPFINDQQCRACSVLATTLGGALSLVVYSLPPHAPCARSASAASRHALSNWSEGGVRVSWADASVERGVEFAHRIASLIRGCMSGMRSATWPRREGSGVRTHRGMRAASAAICFATKYLRSSSDGSIREA
eukprot:COSAG01_NODE_369_length_18046_cov_130.301443_2_plen_160_part_00